MTLLPRSGPLHDGKSRANVESGRLDDMLRALERHVDALGCAHVSPGTWNSGARPLAEARPAQEATAGAKQGHDHCRDNSSRVHSGSEAESSTH